MTKTGTERPAGTRADGTRADLIAAAVALGLVLAAVVTAWSSRRSAA